MYTAVYLGQQSGCVQDVHGRVHAPRPPGRKEEKYAKAPEIFAHCQRIGRQFDLYKAALFQTQIAKMDWDENTRRWNVTTTRDDKLAARFVIIAGGIMHKAKLPGIPGIETFQGHGFHTSRWDYSYTGGGPTGGMTRLADKPRERGLPARVHPHGGGRGPVGDPLPVVRHGERPLPVRPRVRARDREGTAMKLQKKIVVVTGGGSGLGRELVLALLSRGASVAAVDINAAALEETVKLAGMNGANLATYTVNVADRAQVEALPERVISRFGAVDGIINNAGVIQPFVKLKDLDYAAIDRVMNVNLFGTLYMTKSFLPHLLARPEAHITNISSMGGFLPVPGQTIYGASKAAVKLQMRGLLSQ
ncbi:MAG TPA: SDR family NAD(P)-dependent oxidoreductase [Archangium sp.]|uniref:SDR family NAD(P)-dependent oxidoreductase n=1 Tax=Archangium sp. TaxID=1872627 RepID=UPI002E301A4C|nr:SDR family NAD(P)-dependent oxidoreductase [Archangium sp.]HEX5748223.1 SDR family NAD(P)-dependent oxidoreductase [Archangium sp.]